MIETQLRNGYLREEKKKCEKIKEYRGVYISTVSELFILPKKRKI